MRRTYLIAAALAVAAATATTGQANAQGTVLPISAEVKGGIGFPLGDFSDGAETGFGFGATVRYNIIPALAIYGSYNWMEFGAEDIDGDFTDSGFALGGQVSLPVGGAALLNPWARAGVLFHKLDTPIGETDRETGFEVAGGVTFPLGMVIDFTPGLAYKRYGLDGGGDVSYLAIELGLNFNL